MESAPTLLLMLLIVAVSLGVVRLPAFIKSRWEKKKGEASGRPPRGVKASGSPRHDAGLPSGVDETHAAQLASRCEGALRDTQRLLPDFNQLATFEDAASWDRNARRLSTQLLELAGELEGFTADVARKVAAYEMSTTDPPPTRRARTLNASRLSESFSGLRERLVQVAMDLDERIELTPNNTTERAAMARQLRAELKALQLQRKEARVVMADIRAKARAAADPLLPSAWAHTYVKRLASDERRALRRQRDAALLPHETTVAALDRQIIEMERRLNWVQRFDASRTASNGHEDAPE